jgi:archaeal flagellar protein FlaI
MVFGKESKLYSTEVQRQQGETILYINYLSAGFVPSIADNSSVMGRSVDVVLENSNITRIVFVQQKYYSYSSEQVFLLSEIAKIYGFFMKQENILSSERLHLFGDSGTIHGDLNYLFLLLRQDPIYCFKELKRRIKGYEGQASSGEVVNKSALMNYLRFLRKFYDMLGGTKLIQIASRDLDSYVSGSREIYKEIFRSDVLPNFTFTRLVSGFPEGGELIDQYEIEYGFEKFTVTILKQEDDPKFFYHVLPPEYSLDEEKHGLLQLARNVLVEHKPKAEEFLDPEKTRQVFLNIARDLVSDLAKNKKIKLNHRDLMGLSRILVRHTIGFGLLEILLLDEKLQDIVLNAPIAQNRIFVRHEEFEECVTNIIPSYEDANSWAAKLRLQSGRALDEANPVLDTDLVFGDVRARVAAIQEPLSPSGLAYALRRHRAEPWTLPLFIDKGMINSFTAGLLSFFIDGNRTLLVAGTRSSGKTSLLGALMLEIMPKYRTIVIEDTLELPVDALRKIGYDILRMKVRSALTKGGTEVEASEGIRTSLRLGDSALIIGEVRSDEAKALYEAMRVGALANVVAGTIHGDSPYGVFDRVVNDLGVARTSFKATDLILVANPVKTADGLHSKKRVFGLTEVRKHWEKDPGIERGFVDLLKYDVEKDSLEPTQDLIHGDSEIIKSVASNVKGWAGNWDAVWDNILLRGKIKQEIVDYSKKVGRPELMEAKFNSLCNAAFHRFSEEVREDVGLPESKRVFLKWKEWLVKKEKEF